jgi:hypothetical protein
MRYTNIEPSSLRDAKYYLALCKPSPDAELLDQVVRRFPEHADELTEFAIDLALDAAGEAEDQPIEVSEETSPAVSKAISRFQNRLYAEKKAAASPAPSASTETNPFASMKRDELRAFAKNINANLPFVMKLRDRQIQADTISEGFRHRLSEELSVPVDVLVAHFAAQPEMRTGARFKSESKPVVSAKQSFEEAVRTSALTSEQQEFLLKL